MARQTKLYPRERANRENQSTKVTLSRRMKCRHAAWRDGIVWRRRHFAQAREYVGGLLTFLEHGSESQRMASSFKYESRNKAKSVLYK